MRAGCQAEVREEAGAGGWEGDEKEEVREKEGWEGLPSTETLQDND